MGINLVLIGAVWVALATMEDHTPGGRVLRFFAGIAFIVRGTVELMAGFYMRRLAS